MGLKIYFHVFFSPTRVNAAEFIKGIVMHKSLRPYQSPGGGQGEGKQKPGSKVLVACFSASIELMLCPDVKLIFFFETYKYCKCKMCLEQKKIIYWGKIEILDLHIFKKVSLSFFSISGFAKTVTDQCVECHVVMAAEVEAAFYL